ncbi:universal stress protein [Rhodanobacter lindaniclasticus]
MYKHILLPTDGSELSLRAVDAGIALAARLGARVHAFHVIAPFPASTYFAAIVLANEPAYIEEAHANAERYLADVHQRAQAAGVACESSSEVDARPYSAIVGAARKQQCDLIVMASHGWRGFDRLLLGSETHKVILNGDVPVLVCR